MTQENNQFERVIIEGYLETLSDLHIGSGFDESISDYLNEKTTDNEGSVITILRGDNQQPYIPGSSIKGYLFDKANRNEEHWEKELTEQIFGFVCGDKRKAGDLRVSDAFVEKPNPKKAYRYGIAIDPITGTANADKHALFRHEVLPIGSHIHCRFEIDRTSIETIKHFLFLLAHWNGGTSSSMGAMTGKGYGRVKWHRSTIKGLSSISISSWLNSTEELKSFYQDVDIAEVEMLADHNKLSFFIQTNAPIVIHDPQQIRDEEHAPKITCSRTLDNKALIPGTSLKGLLRAWCRKIIISILIADYKQSQTDASHVADNYINGLFGSEKIASYIQLSDALSTGKLQLHIRPMIAIDRFSGGVKGGQYLDKSHQQRKQKEETIEGALVNIEAAINSLYSGDISLNVGRRAPENNGWKGLLLLALRDAMQGDFSIGWGKVRGFGSFKLQIMMDDKLYEDWEDAYHHIQSKIDIQTCLNALHEQLETSVNTEKESAV